jgi:hypothetical protein
VASHAAEWSASRSSSTKIKDGGGPLWSETQNVEADAAGRYSAILSSATADGIPLTVFRSAEVHWISTHGLGGTLEGSGGSSFQVTWKANGP